MKKTKVCFIVLLCLAVPVIALLTVTMGIEAMGKGILSVLLICMLLFALKRSPERAATIGRRFDRMDTEPCTSPTATFADVAANQEALDSLRELADYLKAPEKYLRLGARLPRGVLLYGPPGTGKTLLARALAGEAGVPFYSLSGSDFVQMYVGVGASRVRDLFSKARKAGKCVIFIDEIDAMGKKRNESASDEREQTLNALLSEMSGFKDGDGVIVLAATNRLDTLDPALTRPGRFDRQIEVGLPGRSERLDILRLHCRNKPLASSVDLDAVASDTVRFSGASLECLMNEAAIRAARRGAEIIEPQDIDAAYVSTVAGEDRPAAIPSRSELATVALHEAGHAIASLLLLPENRLTRISILPSSRGAAGYNLSIPVEHAVLERRELCAQIQVLLAGRAAELLLGSEETVTSGASNDLSRAAELAAAMVMDLGMADEPAIALRALQKGCQCSPQDGFARARALLTEQFQQVSQLLKTHVDDLMKLSEALLEKESLNAAQLGELFPHWTGLS